MLRFALPLLAFAGLIVAFVVGLDPERDPSRLPSPFLGKTAPEFDLPRLKNPEERIASRDYAGQTTLVNVWATWCVECRREHGFLMRLAESNEIPLYGLNWRDQRDAALSWLAQLGDPYIASGYDADGRTGIDWGVYAAPETFLISKDGRVLYKHLGALSDAIWEQEFRPLIAADKARAE